ncbi:carbohydrate ABC transporter permease [Paenibacillus sp. Soil787]|uniref:carbohydrate ABC transporter permease n=1 Tax=Paenibacillus sp. Soil787 TaxID=1736411 RepID=UPI000702AD84|nr:sugar ABC transporter permease [Paenibacillus sp. Soil787]KRF18417.1 ABC transporter permease [Paenibacillus sp. Soil787]
MHVSKLTKKMFPQYLLMPALVVYFVLFLVPNLASFYYAFTNWNAYSSVVKFIGLDNFKEIFSHAAGNGDVFKNTTIFAVYTTVLKIFFGLILALLLNEGIRTKNILRTIFFLPITMSVVLTGIMFSEIYSPDGLLNDILKLIGLSDYAHAWIAEPKLAIWSIATVEVWKASGFAMAIFLAALQTVPKEIYEAADIDGTSTFQKLFYITLPYLYNAIVLNTLFGMISGLKVFDLVYVISNGGPVRSSEVLNVTVLNEFSKGSYGYSTALGLILFLFVTLAYLGINFIFKKFEVDVS